MKTNITKIALFALIAGMISFLENFFTPLIPIPGMKLGFSNIVLLVGLIYFSKKEVFFIVLMKSILQALMGGSFTSIMYSLPSGIFALIGMILAMKLMPRVSYIGVSVVGAFFFNFSQVIVSYLVLNSFIYFHYLPWIEIVGTFTGTLNGFIVNELVKKNTLGVILNDKKQY